MKPQQFEQKLQQFISVLYTEVPRINERVALNAFALIKDRVINEGVTGAGKNMGTYSDNELPLFFYYGKSLNKGGDAAIEKAKKEKRGLSYKEFREANKRPTDHVSLSFSGDMWGDIGVVKQIVDESKVLTVVGAKNTTTRYSGKKTVTTDKIMEGNAGRYGDFLELNKREEDLIAQTYDAYLQELINKIF